MGRVIVLLSGGVDSATVLAQAVEDGHAVTALSFDYGQKHARQEGNCAVRLAAHYAAPRELIDLRGPFRLFGSALLEGGPEVPQGHYTDPSQRATVVPFRNGILLAFAVGLAEHLGAEAVLYGAHAGDHPIYPDCRSEFARAFSGAAQIGTYAQVEVRAPFCDRDKAAIVRTGERLGVPWALTWTCYEGQGRPCGRCGACVERREAFAEAGVADPLEAR